VLSEPVAGGTFVAERATEERAGGAFAAESATNAPTLVLNHRAIEL